jgi:hypothetical protein
VIGIISKLRAAQEDVEYAKSRQANLGRSGTKYAAAQTRQQVGKEHF